jgi:hypothetical protein
MKELFSSYHFHFLNSFQAEFPGRVNPSRLIVAEARARQKNGIWRASAAQRLAEDARSGPESRADFLLPKRP